MDDKWTVLLHPEFVPEFRALDKAVRLRLLMIIRTLEEAGPRLGRPMVDTLEGSRHANMKEARIQIGTRYWRFAFAFDPERQAVLLVGGDKGGVTSSRFYQYLIRVADRRFDFWLSGIRDRGRS